MFKKSLFRNRQLAFCLSLLCCLALGLRPLGAQNAQKPKAENRFLFIVDTSSAMSPLKGAADKAVAKLLSSEIDGQLRDGDTIGLWTYNNKLHDEFPMQVWTQSAKQAVFETVVAFLDSQKCEKSARLDRVFPSMHAVIQSSRTLTVILISDGSGLMKGTPFDKDINKLYKDFGADLRKASLPLVTVLAARDGTLFDYTINSPASTIRVPPTAEPVKKTEPVPVLALAKSESVPPPATVPEVTKSAAFKGIIIGNPNPPKIDPVIVPPVAPPAPETKPAPVPTALATPENIPTNSPTNPGDAETVVMPAKTNAVQKAEATPAPNAPIAGEKTVEAKPPPPLTQPPALAVDKPAIQRTHSIGLLLGGICILAAVSIGTIGFLVRVYRESKASHSSLISQSMAAQRQGRDQN